MHFLLFSQCFPQLYIFSASICGIVWSWDKERDISLPNDKILDWSKLKAFADDKINVTEKLKFVLKRVENILGKGENAGYRHFLFSNYVFKRLYIQGCSKSGLCGIEFRRLMEEILQVDLNFAPKDKQK